MDTETVNCNGEDASKGNYSDSESDWGFSGDENEVDDMLEEALPEDFRRAPKVRKLMPSEQEKIKNLVGGDGKLGDDSQSEQMEIDDEDKKNDDAASKFTEKVVTILEEKGTSKFEDLPGGWIQVRHVSGMPVYLHRKTRVCTLAKPYRLGPGSARKHSVPLSAIPCLAYRKALEKESNGSAGTSESLGTEIKALTTEDNSVSDSQGDSRVILSDAVDTIPDRADDISEPCASRELILTESCSVASEGIVISVTDIESTKVISVLEKSSENRDNDDDLEPGEIPDEEEKIEQKKTERNYTVNGELSISPKAWNPASSDLTQTTELLKGNSRKPVTPIHQRLGISIDSKDNPTGTPASAEVLKQLMPQAQVETAQAANEMNSVSPEELKMYCTGLFKFKQVTCKRFRSWSDRRKHAKEQKRMHLQRPTLPDGLQLITFPVQRPVGDSDSGKTVKEEYTMNFQGKSSVCILHEYVQHALRLQPSYSIGESRNSSAPYAATVMINNVQYGSGVGTSKKLAKAAAAAATLEILIPAMKDFLKTNGTTNNDMYHIGYFDQVEMDDPRIPKMCASVSEPSPYALLLACLQRNFGQGSTTDIKFEVVSTGSQANKFRMQTGEYSVEVTASNKREGKQLASQALLCKIHPHIKNFGSFLRLYGNGSVKSVKEKKQEEQQITTLQSKASANSPNYAILNKLREEMLKLRAKRQEEQKAKETDGTAPTAHEVPL